MTDAEREIVSKSINKLAFITFKYLQSTNLTQSNLFFSPINLYAILLEKLKALPVQDVTQILSELDLVNLTLSEVNRIFSDLITKVKESSGNLSGLGSSELFFEVNWDADVYKPNSYELVFNGINGIVKGSFSEVCKNSSQRFLRKDTFLYNISYFLQKNSLLTIELYNTPVKNNISVFSNAFSITEWQEANKKSIGFYGNVCTIIPRFKNVVVSKVDIGKMLNLSSVNLKLEQKLSVNFNQAGTKQNLNVMESENPSERVMLTEAFGMIVSGSYKLPYPPSQQLNFSAYQTETIILMGLIQQLTPDEIACDINQGCYRSAFQ
ncbi:hypothetical protein COW20_02185 [bacterium (Candidatus Blackallbacteria) CG13_big_fil_rev_8_21_14_2_50_49_14]|nr:MAG: hypothetical protein COW64_12080 [bacterium (Candidatus Blackallbacteria) CG18_big_fil_WC_8_21_14_2_50_49_26]PIW50332.1 MAG: hypothetical protein COW20_02185 [bacterium (Candidatus Blackallbacteria) CG13_big_fil_rev_8_21_14_2_50_49_14]